MTSRRSPDILHTRLASRISSPASNVGRERSVQCCNARLSDRPASRRALGLLRREHAERAESTESKLYHVAGKAMTEPVRDAPGSAWCPRSPAGIGMVSPEPPQPRRGVICEVRFLSCGRSLVQAADRLVDPAGPHGPERGKAKRVRTARELLRRPYSFTHLQP